MGKIVENYSGIVKPSISEIGTGMLELLLKNKDYHSAAVWLVVISIYCIQLTILTLSAIVAKESYSDTDTENCGQKY
uniref:Uncharacterized protein n=1 Tax=Glossina palpalis gambiensis TaxID=67801 RepID=A0A1B0BTT6_9MUSC